MKLKISKLALLCAFASFIATTQLARAQDLQDLSDQGVNWMKTALACEKPVEKYYCDAMDAFTKGGPVTLTDGTLAGSSMFVAGDGHVEEAGYIAFKDGKVLYSKVDPETDEERKQIANYLQTIHEAGIISSNDPIAAYVKTLGFAAKYPSQIIGRSTVYSGNNFVFMRQAGNKIYVIESHEGDPLAKTKGNFHQSAITMALGGFKAYYIGVLMLP